MVTPANDATLVATMSARVLKTFFNLLPSRGESRLDSTQSNRWRDLPEREDRPSCAENKTLDSLRSSLQSAERVSKKLVNNYSAFQLLARNESRIVYLESHETCSLGILPRLQSTKLLHRGFALKT